MIQGASRLSLSRNALGFSLISIKGYYTFIHSTDELVRSKKPDQISLPLLLLDFPSNKKYLKFISVFVNPKIFSVFGRIL